MTGNAPEATAADSTGRHRAGRAQGAAGQIAGGRRGATGRERGGGRIRLLSVLGLGVGVLVAAASFGPTAVRPLIWGEPEPQVGVPVHGSRGSTPSSAPQPPPAVPVATPSGVAPSGTPDPSPSPTPTASAPGDRATPTPSTSPRRPTGPAGTPTPAPGGTTGAPVVPPPPAAPPQPVLLGPDGRDALARMIDGYCDRHVGGTSWADPRGDGGWECDRILLSSRTVDLDLACRDAYGDGAFPDNPDPGDAHGWRCYRR
ncbi:hypothetical protein [Plantactinospora sonchi]|uniref:Excalibur calcium-binding domain-containing protein n=1 Tax=Plantactinospora sonchi TaxID=1544735 RepID=A0ABU7RQ20_9ACTN